MPQKLKNHGLRSYLNQNQNSKNDCVSKQTSDDSFSPYKNALGQIKRLSLNNDGEDDFSSPKPIKTIPKMFKPPKKITSKKTTRAKTSNSVLKRTKDNFKNVDVNAEHLQMALALSKSTFVQEYPERENETREEDLPSCLSPIKIPKVTTFLEKYGFKSTRNRSNPEFPTNYIEETKKRKNPKFRFVTPILYMRTQEDRECLINTRVSLIISQNKTNLPKKNSVEETYSAELQNYLSDKKCWNLNSCLAQNSEYMSPSLELPPPKLSTGCLLKSWEEISGREKSPQKTLPRSETPLNCDTDIVKESDALTKSPTNNEKKNNQCDNKIPVNNFTTVCSSPDLFASDDESFHKSNETSKVSECLVATEETAAELSSSKKLIVDNEENLSDKSFNTKEKINETEEDSPSSSSRSVDKMSEFEPSTSKYHQNYFCKPHKPESNKSKSCSKISLSSLTREVQENIDSDSSNTDEEIADVLGKTSELYSRSKYFSKDKQAKYLQVTSKSETELSSTRTSDIGSEGSLKKFNSFTDSCNIEFEISQKKSLSKSKMFLDNFSKSSRSKSQFSLSKIGLEDLKKPSCSYSKSQSKSSATQSKSSVSEEEKAENQISKIHSGSSSSTSCFKLLDKNDKGIEFFESFYDIAEKNDGKIVGDSFIDLCQSSDEEQPNEVSVLSQKSFEVNCTKMEEELPDINSTYQGNASSLNYNHTKSLNVTDYVMAILNSQEDTNPEEDLQQSQSTSSQESIEISSDEELNYSSRFSAICKNANIYDLDNFDDCIGTDFKAEDLHTIHLDLKTKYQEHKKANDERQIDGTNENLIKQQVTDDNISADNKIDKREHIDAENFEDCASTLVNNIRENPDRNVEENLEVKTPTQLKNNTQSIFNFQTPSNNLIIKTNDVTPMEDYDAMDTPKIRKELDRFGIKPFKRRRGVEMLKYIYESTHPIVSMEDFNIRNDEEIEEKLVKKRKLNTLFENNEINTIKIVGTELIQNENEADLLFERKFSKKTMSCRIPLQIAWYNFLCCNSSLKENILLYEPIQLEVIHSMLKEQSGCNFHLEELITFLDRKCITFRTSQWQGARKKHKKGNIKDSI